MNENYLTKSYVNHYLQADMVSKLANAEGPLRFSSLKEDGVENSLFMYHANKLIDRGIIAKQDDGFSLTQKGARWANHAGVNNSFKIMTPRPLIQLLVHGPDDTILIATRRGQLKELLNEHLLPGSTYPFGTPLDENITSLATKILGTKHSTLVALTVAEVIHEFSDEFVSHVLSYIFEVTTKNTEIGNHNASFDLAWMPRTEITLDNPEFKDSQFIPLLLAKLDSLESQETFIIKS
jgi:hypothetical protein